MKTVKEWIESIEMKDIRDAALKNTEDAAIESEEPCPSLELAIRGAFMWVNTIEGFDYWLTISNQARDGELKTNEHG